MPSVGLHQSSVMSEASSSPLCDVIAEPPANGRDFSGPVALSLFLSCLDAVLNRFAVSSPPKGRPVSDVTHTLSSAEWPVWWSSPCVC